MEMVFNEGDNRLRFEPFDRDAAVKYLTGHYHGLGLKMDMGSSIDDIDDDFSISDNPFQFFRPYVWINWSRNHSGADVGPLIEVVAAPDDERRSNIVKKVLSDPGEAIDYAVEVVSKLDI